MKPTVKIVKADPELHSKDIEELIQELADYERMPDGPKIKADRLKEDLKRGHFHAFVAILSEAHEQWPASTAVGYLIYYYAYSTWEGRYMFIEDVYLKPELRRFGIGSALWSTATKIAFEEKLPRIEWDVLDWNESAIQFYNRLGAINLHETDSWATYRLDRASIEKLAEGL